jgi:hypothetical protein
MMGVNQKPFRIEPQGPASAYRTFSYLTPPDTHMTVVSCEQFDCQMQANGFMVSADEQTELGARQSVYIREFAGRHFMENRDDTGKTTFTFPPGEDCFLQHRVKLDRDAFFIARGGDWRGNPRKEYRVHDRPEHWQEEFAEHQDKLNQATK